MSSPSEESDSRSLLSTTLADTNPWTTLYPLYQWKPLSDPAKQIRVLNIVPYSNSDGFRCSLKIVPHVILPSPGPYQALSYVWGDSTQKVRMNIYEGDKCLSVYVTQNLEAAIRDLTSPIRGRYYGKLLQPLCLWVDALCIDQNNDQERSMQVQIMAEIYARAFGVLVWLGPISGSQTEQELNIQQVKDLLVDGLKRPYQMRSDRGDSTWLAVDSNYFAMKKLLLHPWWSRIWVVQEAIL